MVTAIAAAYVRNGTLPAVAGVLSGVTPVVIAIIGQALWGLGRTALKTWGLAALAVVSLALALANVHLLLILLGAGLAVAIARGMRVRRTPPVRDATRSGELHSVALGLSALSSKPTALSVGTAVAGGGDATAVVFGLWPLFGAFLKIGAVLFGPGYVLLAFLRADLVQRLGWLTERRLLDAVAVGQVTPGLMFTTATFIGYPLGGGAGAVVATVGIFLPAFVLVAASRPFRPTLRRSAASRTMLDGVNVASLALMAAVTWQLARGAITGWVAAAIATTSALLLIRYKVNTTTVIVGGAIVGWLASGAGIL